MPPSLFIRHFFTALATVTFALLLGACSGDDVEQVSTSAPDDEPTAISTTSPAATVEVVSAVPTPAPTAVPDRSAAPPAPPALLSADTEGAAVEEIQDLLNDFIGYTDATVEQISEDGVFGPNTEAAQRSFESYAGLPVDGAASVGDRAELEQLVASLESEQADSVVALGDESEFVGTWQSRLNTWNELVAERPVSIPVDNRFGPDTEQATRELEAALGLQVDGIVEPADRAALRSAISDIRAESDATVVLRSLVGESTVIVKSLYVNDQYCMRFVVGFAADERCTPGLEGDVNTAWFVEVNGVSFVGGTANPNVAFAQITTRGQGTTPAATRQLGDSLARAWVLIVDDEPETIELRSGDGDSVLEMRFTIAPTDRDFFGSTISLTSTQYAQTFFVDSCVRPNGTDLVLEASLATADMVINVIDGTGTILIDAGTPTAPVQILGNIDVADLSTDRILLTGAFTGDIFDQAPFTATANC